MTFKIVHVEDDVNMRSRIAEAIVADGDEADLELIVVTNPAGLASVLEPNVDLVLADIGFPNAEGRDISRLEEILTTVESISAAWPGDPELDRPTVPVIVHTGRSADLPILLEHRHRLFDVWHKAAATPEYVAWQLRRVARELERTRPGRTLQKIASNLEAGPSWHTGVRVMLGKYASGWSELDQIERCGKSVAALSDALGCKDGKRLWQLLERWELIDRATDQRVRGHARHSLHVFWLGYVLLNNPILAPEWERAWDTLLRKRGQRDIVQEVAWREAINAAWFFASVFHDVGYVVQDAARVVDAVEAAGSGFDTRWFTRKEGEGGKYLSRVTDVIAEFRATGTESYDVLATKLLDHWTESNRRRTPDHGLASAGRLIGAESTDAKCKWWLREAARTVGLHSAFPAVAVAFLIDFEQDPLGCLLLLLDQLQTWDRQRPERLAERDWPERAELVRLSVRRLPGGRALVDLAVRYIVRRHVEQSRAVFRRVEEALTDVLQTLPVAAMRDLRPKLPFDIKVEFFLAERLLQTF